MTELKPQTTTLTVSYHSDWSLAEVRCKFPLHIFVLYITANVLLLIAYNSTANRASVNAWAFKFYTTGAIVIQHKSECISTILSPLCVVIQIVLPWTSTLCTYWTCCGRQPASLSMSPHFVRHHMDCCAHKQYSHVLVHFWHSGLIRHVCCDLCSVNLILNRTLGNCSLH